MLPSKAPIARISNKDYSQAAKKSLTSVSNFVVAVWVGGGVNLRTVLVALSVVADAVSLAVVSVDDCAVLVALSVVADAVSLAVVSDDNCTSVFVLDVCGRVFVSVTCRAVVEVLQLKLQSSSPSSEWITEA
jgi:hypothetical protein